MMPRDLSNQNNVTSFGFDHDCDFAIHFCTQGMKSVTPSALSWPLSNCQIKREVETSFFTFAFFLLVTLFATVSSASYRSSLSCFTVNKSLSETDSVHLRNSAVDFLIGRVTMFFIPSVSQISTTSAAIHEKLVSAFWRVRFRNDSVTETDAESRLNHFHS